MSITGASYTKRHAMSIKAGILHKEARYEHKGDEAYERHAVAANRQTRDQAWQAGRQGTAQAGDSTAQAGGRGQAEYLRYWPAQDTGNIPPWRAVGACKATTPLWRRRKRRRRRYAARAIVT